MQLRSARELRELGLKARKAGEPGKALELLESALNAARAEGLRPVDQASILSDIGQTLVDSRNPATSPSTGGKPGRERGVDAARATSLYNQGREQLATDQPGSALRSFEEALPLLGRTPDAKLERDLRLASAAAALQTGRLSSARQHLESALPRLEGPDDRPLKVKTLSELALLQAELGDSAAARVTYQQALALVRTLADRQGEARVLDDLAGLSFRDGAWLDAADGYQLAVERWEELKLLQESVIGWTRIAWCYEKLGLDDRAQEALNQAMVRVRRHGLRSLEASLNARLGRLVLARGMMKEAKHAFDTAIGLRGLGFRTASWIAPLGLARTLAAMNDPRADDAYEVALSALDRATNDSVLNPIDAPWLADRPRAYQELIGRLLQAGQKEQALEVAERAQVRLFRDLLEARPGDPLIGPAGAGSGLTLIGKGGGHEEVVRQVELVLGGRSPAEVIENAPKPTLQKADGIRALAKLQNATVVTYHPVGDQLAVWTVDPAGQIEMKLLPVKAERIERSVISLLRALGGTAPTPRPDGTPVPAPDLRGLLSELHQALIAPIAPALPTASGRIAFVAPGTLAAVPFAMLLDEKGQPLMVRGTVATAPALAHLVPLKPGRVVVIAGQADVYLLGEGARPGVASAGERIEPLAQALRDGPLKEGAGVSVMSGATATEEALDVLLATSARVHVVARAFYHRGHPWLSGALMARAGQTAADDGVATAVELPFGQLQSPLVVLPPFDGADHARTQLHGLELAWLSAGVQRLVIPLGNAGLSGDLAVRFYRAVKAGQGAAEALRTAQLETLEAGADLRTVAGLVVVGAF